MFEIIKWFMLLALLIAMAKASETLETLENLGLLTSDVLYDNILVLSALFNFFLLIITGLVFVLTLSSGFPPVFSKTHATKESPYWNQGRNWGTAWENKRKLSTLN